MENSQIKSHQCCPSKSIAIDSGEPKFCMQCGSLIGRSSQQGNKPLKFCRSETFETPELGISPSLMLNQMFVHQKPMTRKPVIPAFCEFRSQIVDFLESLSRQQDLKITTFLLAIRLLDEICSIMDFQKKELMLIALTCLSLAAKLEEHAQNIPVALLRYYLNDKFSHDKIIEAENIILGMFGFNIRRETAIDFMYFYLSRGVITDIELNALPLINRLELPRRLEETAVRLTIHLSKDFEFNFMAPSFVAAAVVLFCRRIFNLSSWPDELSQMTRTSFKSLETLYPIISTIFNKCSSLNGLGKSDQKDLVRRISNTTQTSLEEIGVDPVINGGRLEADHSSGCDKNPLHADHNAKTQDNLPSSTS